MARTTPELVRGVIEVNDEIDLDPFISASNKLVTARCSDAGYDTDLLQEIETWLAAHFYAIRDPRTTFEGVGAAQLSYESKVDIGLKVTRYGQQAMRLDYAGGLASLDNTLNKITTNLTERKRITWLGSSNGS
jgi:hypothetical protein